MPVIHWTPRDLTTDPEINEKYRDDVMALVDALYNDSDLRYEFASGNGRAALALYCSKRRCTGASGFYRAPYLSMITSVDSDDGVFRSPDFKYYLVDYYSDHAIVADLISGVFGDLAVTHIFQELMYRIVEDHSEYSVDFAVGEDGQ